MNEELKEQLAEAFRAEGQQLLDKLGQLLADLSTTSPDKASELLTEIGRHLHTLKGASASAGFQEVRELVHSLEELLKRYRNPDEDQLFDLSGFMNDVIGVIKQVIAGEEMDLAAMQQMVQNYAENMKTAGTEKQPEEAEDSEQKEAPQYDEEEKTAESQTGANESEKVKSSSDASPRKNQPRKESGIFVQKEKLQAIHSSSSELSLIRRQAEHYTDDLKKFRNEFDDLVRRVISNNSKANQNGLQIDLKEQLKLFSSRLYRIEDSMVRYVSRMQSVSEDVGSRVKAISVIRARDYFEPLSRVVHEAAAGYGVRVAFHVEDHDAELDRILLDRLREPISHMLRNSVGHGIESAEERKAAGKPPTGTITLETAIHGDSALITLEDDGRGLDMDGIEARGREMGILKEGESLNQEQILEIICRHDTSTRKDVDEFSGRGIGMNVVQQEIRELRGTLDVETRPGEGTTFTIKVPLQISRFYGMMARSGNFRFGIPVDFVERVMKYEPDKVSTFMGKPVYEVNEEKVSLVEMAAILDTGIDRNEDADRDCILLNYNSRQLVLMVDELIEDLEMYLKSLPAQFRNQPVYMGVTMTVEGKLLPVIQVSEIFNRAEHKSHATAVVVTAEETRQDDTETETDDQSTTNRSSEENRDVILVVDDSPTTRILEQNILETVGYQVITATNGVEAMQTFRENDRIGLVITDIEMPQMDGLELSRTIRQESQKPDIPIIMVTSLKSEEDQQKGRDYNVDAYIIKGDFSQENFLKTVREFV